MLFKTFRALFDNFLANTRKTNQEDILQYDHPAHGPRLGSVVVERSPGMWEVGGSIMAASNKRH